MEPQPDPSANGEILVVCCLFQEQRLELGQFLGILGGHVVRLRKVVSEVVELPTERDREPTVMINTAATIVLGLNMGRIPRENNSPRGLIDLDNHAHPIASALAQRHADFLRQLPGRIPRQVAPLDVGVVVGLRALDPASYSGIDPRR
jgi:hypothetical protein